MTGKSVPGLPGFQASASSASAYSSMLLIDPGTLSAGSGPPLTDRGKPEVLYVATEYCPYCAMENWPLIVALSRFGQFTGLTSSRSAEFDHIAPVDSWTFYGSHYTSSYLAFVPVERYSNVLLNAKANPNAGESYRKLQQLTPAQLAHRRTLPPDRRPPRLRLPGIPQERGVLLLEGPGWLGCRFAWTT